MLGMCLIDGSPAVTVSSPVCGFRISGNTMSVTFCGRLVGRASLYASAECGIEAMSNLLGIPKKARKCARSRRMGMVG